MNVAIILPTIISRNGPSKQAVELAKILSKSGHNVVFFTYAYSSKDSYVDFKNFTVYRCVDIEDTILYKVTKNVSILEKAYLYLAVIFIFNFGKLFKNKSIDVLNPHDWFGLWTINTFKNKSKVVAIINDAPVRKKGSLLDIIKLYIDRKCVNKISHIVVLDNVNKKKTINWLSIKEDKVSVIRSGIDIKKYINFKKQFDIRKSLKINPDGFIIICANLLMRHRRYEDVLYSIAKLKEFKKQTHLIILSKTDFDIGYADFLKAVIAEKNLTPNVHLIDRFFTDEERMTYIAGSDLLVFSNSPQTWGLTVIEAMALGVPVVVSTGAGVSEVLHHGDDAIIYKARDVNELSKQLLKYIKNRKDLKRIAKNGQEYIAKNFSWEKFGKEIERLMINNS